jgi:dTDP-4-amino-4,6-dideoxygalactose transaminase
LPVAASSSPVAFARPSIGDAEIEEVVAALRSGWLTTGPRTREFERRFAEITGAPHAVAVNSCTAALHLSLLVSGIKNGDEVVTTPLTFCATANAIMHAGATPIFADIDLRTWNLEAADAASRVTSRTRALLPVHFAGRPIDGAAFRTLANRRGLALIEDAAHAVGAATPAGPVGSIGDFTCFSFYATKNLTTGEGGMVTTASAHHAEQLRTAALHGLSRDAWARYSGTTATNYDVVMAGFKYNMSDVQAAIGLGQLARLDEMRQRREAIWRAYDEAFRSLPIAVPAAPAPGTSHARHLYTILIDARDLGLSRDAVAARLGTRGIGTAIHFRALHLHHFYAERFGLKRGMYPNAEYVSDRTLSLPLSSAMSDEDVSRVIGAVSDVCMRRRS